MADLGFAVELLGWTADAVDDVARRRGWTEAAIERLELGWDTERQRVVIPVRDEAGADLGELRYDPTSRQPAPKMLAGRGVPRALFPPPELIGDQELGPGRTVWLLEGEPDTVRGWSLGLAAVGVPGAQNWRDEWASRFTGRHLRVVVCFDCDTSGREGAQRAATAIVRAGVDARIVDLDPDRADGYDVTDWARDAAGDAERDQARRLLEAIADKTPMHEPPPEPPPAAAVPTASEAVAQERPWRSVPWSTFRDESPPAHRWLIDGLLPAGSLCFIAGPPKRGKTWIAISIALALALGRPFAPEPPAADELLDDDDRFAGFEIPHARHVLYVALEGSQTGLRTRIGALARGAGADPDGDELERLHMLYRPRPFDLAELAGAQWLVDEAAEVDAALVIVDVLRAAARFDENAASDFARIRDRLEPLLQLDRSVALAHHFGKLNETQKERSPGERMAGTGAMYGALDVGFLITRSDNGARTLGVDVEARDFAAPDRLGLSIVGDGSGKHGGFTYADTATLLTDRSAAAARDYAAELETLFADGKWRIPKEAADSKQGGIGVGLDELRDAIMPPLCTPPPETPDAPTRFVRLAAGDAMKAATGRSSKTAQPFGTWAMYEALPEPRPDRLRGPTWESVRTDLGAEVGPVGPPADRQELIPGTDPLPSGAGSAGSVPGDGSSGDDAEVT